MFVWSLDIALYFRDNIARVHQIPCNAAFTVIRGFEEKDFGFVIGLLRKCGAKVLLLRITYHDGTLGNR